MSNSTHTVPDSLPAETRTLLFTTARSALQKSYAPYSKFRVGCAVLTYTGEVIGGANIENCSYPATSCKKKLIYTGDNSKRSIRMTCENEDTIPAERVEGEKREIHDRKK